MKCSFGYGTMVRCPNDATRRIMIVDSVDESIRYLSASTCDYHVTWALLDLTIEKIYSNRNGDGDGNDEN